MAVNFEVKIRFNRVYKTDGTKHGLRPYREGDGSPELRVFESDRGRILNSAAVRRLQQKTQVFPLERNAAVRSRLTHSLEVQQVGRHITQKIFETLKKRELINQYGLNELERQMESIVEMSCLMHDIGNPPFGHFGEAAINDWFRKNLKAIGQSAGIHLPDALQLDLQNFEGNAQAIRLVHTLLGLNLTYSQVSGIMKYTRRGDQPKPEKSNDLSYLKKKVGYYLSEHQFIEDLKTSLRITDGCRSPFAYIMEAADDISYGLADLEDAVEKGILDIQKLSQLLVEEYQTIARDFDIDGQGLKEMETIVGIAQNSARRASICGDSQFFIFMRVELSKRLPEHAANNFIDHIEAVFDGHYNAHLIEDRSTNHALVKTLKNIAVKHAFGTKEVESRELQGYKILSGLLDTYHELLTLSAGQFQQLVEGADKPDVTAYQHHLYKKLPNKHIRAYQAALRQENLGNLPLACDPQCWELYFRIRLIQDYISGMTDQFAFDEYRMLHVIDEL
ncbi:dGTPase [Photobacterium sp. CCB-ST2H9]|uniref:dGTPase n=1 Tax=Photobacterium sp. CCB-ST2H9 TaxID=2912855 RepID=UPI00200509DE|nr:dGTPase [Photobacterium sp. CCB-ST2H9]UTM59882.1 dGTPase [Photobacterium sp. CCB-ST2H9]